jgi:hypothetical protein
MFLSTCRGFYQLHNTQKPSVYKHTRTFSLCVCVCVYLFAVVSSRQEQTIVYHVDLLILVVVSSRKEGTYTIYNNTYQQPAEGWR